MQKQPHISTNLFMLIGVMAAWIFFPANAFTQPVVKISHGTACSNTEILVPVTIKHFEDVATFSLFIKVDTAAMDFLDVENVNDLFASGSFLGSINLENQIIILNWMSLSAVNIDSGLLCTIRILLKKDSVNFDFQENCEMARSDLSVIQNVVYIDGSRVPLSSYSAIPATQSLLDGSTATIQLAGLADGVSCQWQRKEGAHWTNLMATPPFSGVQTSQLSIQPVSTALDSSLFRGLLSNGICSEGSQVSQLLVMPEDVKEWNTLTNPSLLHIYPNPVNKILHCTFSNNVIFAELRLINAEGVVLSRQQVENVVAGKKLSIDFSQVKSGIYFLQLFSHDKKMATVKVLRN